MRLYFHYFWFIVFFIFFFFFFFQAEDGIRDIGVTGVQTCALPISSSKFCVVDVKRLQHRFKTMKSDLLRKTRATLRELAAAEAELERAVRQKLRRMAMKDSL